MLTCTMEFDNDIASSCSPKEFIERYVFGNRVQFIEYDKETRTAIYDVLADSDFPKIKIMTIRMKNLKQI